MTTTANSGAIHEAVRSAYGGRVRKYLDGRDTIELVAASPAASDEAACCGPTCCGGDAVEVARAEATAADPCCETSCCGAESTSEQITNVARLYADGDVADLPATVTDVSFGCGNPTAIAAMKPGEVVLDLGSGGGIDVFLAAKMVGPQGFVYGVDMTPEMVDLARANAAKVGATNVEFRRGQIESIPLGDATVDVIISNCVINLSPDKDQVFREAFRVLKPGGRLQVSDIVWLRPAPAAIKDDMEQWAGCVAGAFLEGDYLFSIARAGFVDVSSVPAEYEGSNGLASAAVTAFKPV